MNKTLAIIGSGDLGLQIAHYAICDNHYKQVVFIDDFEESDFKNGIKVIGKSNEIQTLYDKRQFDELIVGIGYRHLLVRKEMFDTWSTKIPFGTIIHSSVYKDDTVKIGAGCIIYPSCSLDIRVHIEENTIVNMGCTIAHDSVIGSHCFLSPRVALAGFVNVEELCILGINSTVIDNISLIKETHIGGATVVTKSTKIEGLYVGNPQRFIR
jgi:sugar O-acyltransferase (sialic acid O-acetyltransferase NeuD family)